MMIIRKNKNNSGNNDINCDNKKRKSKKNSYT